MLGQPLRLLLVAAILGCVPLSSCSSLTAKGRREAAYRNYVKKYSHNRVKQQKKFKVAKTSTAPLPTNPAKTSDSVNESGPQSITASNSEN